MTAEVSCQCPTRVAHEGGCERAPSKGTLCSFCFYGHNEVRKYRVSKDTPVALVIEATSEALATISADDRFKRVWERLDEAAAELAKELGVDVVIGYPYDDIEVTVEDEET